MIFVSYTDEHLLALILIPLAVPFSYKSKSIKLIHRHMLPMQPQEVFLYNLSLNISSLFFPLEMLIPDKDSC